MIVVVDESVSDTTSSIKVPSQAREASSHTGPHRKHAFPPEAQPKDVWFGRSILISSHSLPRLRLHKLLLL